MSDTRDEGRSKTWSSSSAFVGDTKVLRALPHPGAEAVGPFVFLDHFGPVVARSKTLPAHPHAGIEVMTYLLAGSNEHRDSAGHRGIVDAGGAQWMKAGRGVLHSERIIAENAPITHGLQLWSRMPIALQDDPPSYRGIKPEDVPTWQGDSDGREAGALFRLLAGTWRDRRGPISLTLPAFMLHISLAPGATVTVELPEKAHEYGAYAIKSPDDGLEVNFGFSLPRGEFALLASNEGSVVFSHAPGAGASADVFVLGGEPAPRPLVFGGPFVFESHSALQRANRRYAAGEMGTLDGVPF